MNDLEPWHEAFDQFYARFADLFARRESREQAKKYLWGLLSQIERKNGWQVADVVGDPIPDRMQRLLYRVPWDADAARDRLQHFIIETFGDEEGIGVVGETSFLKKGTHSVGVAYQCPGVYGEPVNGQVATMLSYAARGAHVLLDRALYLPREWVRDKTRRTQARIPEQVGFATKPEQATAMLLHAWKQGVPMKWVTGGAVFGDAPQLREAIRAHGRCYVLAVSSTTLVWTGTRRVLVQVPPGGRARGISIAPAVARAVCEVVAPIPAHAWKPLTVIEDEDLVSAHWVRTPVVEYRGGLASSRAWLLARRSLADPRELSYYLAHAPEKTSLETLVRIASMCGTVERCVGEARAKTGLDEYEVRFWHSWYRHITLSMMAHAWLTSIRR